MGSPSTPTELGQNKSQVIAKLIVSTLALVTAVVLFLDVFKGDGENSVSAPEPASLDLTQEVTVLVGASPEEKLNSSDQAAQQEAIQTLLTQIKSDWPDDHRRAFLVEITPGALGSAIDNCIPPSVTIGQAIIESGWGRSLLAKKHKNLFGIKGYNAKSAVKMKTQEFRDGKAIQVYAPFRAFNDWGESISRHDELLSTDPRYAEAMKRWNNWELFLKTLAPVYATSPHYVSLVSKIVVDYRLDTWDQLVAAAASKHSNCPGTSTRQVDE